MAFNLRDINFHYNGVHEDHDIIYDCENSGCQDEGICRCGFITNVYITNVDIPMISNIIYDDINSFGNSITKKRNVKLDLLLNGYGKDMDLYMIDRILRKWKVYNPDSWDVEICNGYYGQEVEEISLKLDICNELNSEIIKALSIEPLNERVEYLLKLEYGRILPELEECQWSLEIIDLDQLTFGSDSNVKKCKKEIEKESTKYKGYFYDDKNYYNVLTKLIRGLAIKNGKNYRLIDGYHRCLATGVDKVKLLITNGNDK
jgi:hypothetical protein